MTRDQDELILVEDPAVELLTEYLGWVEKTVPEVDMLRSSPKDPMLIDHLKDQIRNLNPWITEENIDRVIWQITSIPTVSLLDANEKIHEMLERGTTVTQDIGDGWGEQGRTVRLIDYENPDQNSFWVVRQFPVKHIKTCYPDIVLFINGIPVVVIECKSPNIEKPLEKGIRQLNRYQENGSEFKNTGCPALFKTSQVLISTSRDNAKSGTNNTVSRHWAEWKDPYSPFYQGEGLFTITGLAEELGKAPTAQDILLTGLCRKENLLDIIRNYVVFEREYGRIVKKIPKYQQYRATGKTLKEILVYKKGGFIWHWQGSGKSHTMLYTAIKLRREESLNNPTIVIITDRTDLDQQIHGVFLHCGFPNPINAANTTNLRELLARPAGLTVMTTIQKFQDAAKEYPVLTTEENIFVLIDEAHRSQYKKLAANMRKALPNAHYIGFTGTPISKKDRDTFGTFGPYIDRYDHIQSEKDEMTVPIFYEGRMPELSVGKASLDDLFNRIFKTYSKEDKDRIIRRFAKREDLAIAPERIEAICLDLINHFETYIEPNNFKAQVVAPNRRGAIRYKETIERLYGSSCDVLISKLHNDDAEYAPYYHSKTEEQEVIRKYKEEEDPRFIIVCDKLLAGFDAPREQVMYLDAPLKEHTLMQAFGRVNRRYTKKDYGLVVDYWGNSDELREALEMYREEGFVGVVHTDMKKEVLPQLQSAQRSANNVFSGIAETYDKELYIQECVKHLEPKDVRLSFDKKLRKFAQYVDMLLPDPEALKYSDNLELLTKIRIRAKNQYADEQTAIDECGEKVRKLIDDHIRADGVSIVSEPLNIQSYGFKKEVEKVTSDEGKAVMIEHAVKKEISVKYPQDPIFYESLLARLSEIIEDYQKERISSAERLKKASEILDEAKHPERRAEKYGVESEVIPFYDRLTKDLENPDQYKKTASDILHVIKQHAVVGWRQGLESKRLMRQGIKRVLRETEFPSDKIQEVSELLIELAEQRY